MNTVQDLSAILQAVRTGHYPSFALAVAAASQRCALWRDAVTGERFEAESLAARKVPGEGTAFYMLSSEGAIGACPGREWETRWLYLPITEEDLRAEAEARAEAERRAADEAARAAEEAERKAEEAERRAAEEAARAREEAERRAAEEAAKAKAEAEARALAEKAEAERRAAAEEMARAREEAGRKAAGEASAQAAVAPPVPPVAPAPAGADPKTRARFCPECGTPYKSGEARFCTNCGTPRR